MTTDPLRLLYRDPDRTPWLYMLRHAAGQQGLDIQVDRAPGRQYGELLENGSVDLLAENYYVLQVFRARGVSFVSLATTITWLNEQLFVAPEISSLDDLKRGRFALRGIGSSEMIERVWVKDHLDESTELTVYREEEVGRWGQWKKVLSGECQGTLVTNFYADAPRAAGLKALPIPRFGYIGNVTLTTHRRVMDADRGRAEALVRAAFEASRLFKTDAQAALGVLSREPKELLKIATEGALERVYAILRDELCDLPIPSMEGITNAVRMVEAREPDVANFNPLLMWDLSFASKIADECGGPRLF